MSIIGTNPHLTVASKEDNLASRTHAGQAHWATRYDVRCRDCASFKRQNVKKGTCAKAIELSQGRTSQPFPPTAYACKYFEAKPK